MKTLKVRGWNTKRGEMRYWDVFSDFNDNAYYHILDCEHKMLFTGLHDKNGTPIFEGDIVKSTDDGVEVKTSITWQEAFLCFDFPLGATDVEVIGNLYENPNILPS